jgi:primosomal protein N' (replication factor Y)
VTAQPNLFGIIEEEPSPPELPVDVRRYDGPVAAVAIEDSLDKLLDYAVPKKLQSRLAVGQRVKVPLGRGNRAALGYVVAKKDGSDFPAGKIKSLSDIADERVLVTPALLELARWMSRYYCAPLGTVLDSVIPAAVRKRVGLGYVQMVRPARPRDQLQAAFEKGAKSHKRRAILARLLQLDDGESIQLTRLAEEANTRPPTVRKLAAAGLIAIKAEPQQDFVEQHEVGHAWASGIDEVPVLNEDQTKVFADLEPRLTSARFSVNLLYGVTGSGKTEIYLRCIDNVVAAGRQAIVLVPEIALTPQTVRRFTARFARVAVLHSGLSAAQRHRFWQQCATGRADVVVGARSAIFAPVPKPGIIVVDEEHEASYKQDQSPRYNARDVAIKRAQIENVPVLLGSATPSLETFHRVTQSAIGNRQSAIPEDAARYHLLTLPRRVRGLAMPHVELIDMKMESRLRPDRGIHLISQRLEHLLRATIQQGRQAILLLNRRGYSNFVYCASCQNPVQCKYCDTTMTYHRSAGANVGSAAIAKAIHTGQLQCHYCLAVAPLPPACPQCGKLLTLFGLGTQRVEEELAKKFDGLKFARVDSDSMRSGRDYEALLSRFARNEIQVMLGTQMIAKGLDYPNVTLVGVISGDTALALPDFRAAERTFQLITQVAGRAGRGNNPGRVVLQTFLPEDPTIQAAIKQDFNSFARTELEHRREIGLPPFTRMVRIIVRDQDQEKLHERTENLGAQVATAVTQIAEPSGTSSIQVKGPMPCAINRIAGYYRNQIILTSPRAELLQRTIALLREQGHLATSDRIAVDVDPVSLL